MNAKMKKGLASWIILVCAAIMASSILVSVRDMDLSANPTARRYTWINMDPAIAPSARWGTAMTYDSDNGVVVLFGGSQDFEFLSDTWIYSVRTNSWTNMNPSVLPPARSQHAMAYDSKNKVVVMFGGWRTFGWPPYDVLADTWTYDVNTNTWTEKSPANAPSGRFGHGMVYDALHFEILLVGGRVGHSFLGDTWSYNVATNTWTLRNPTGYFYPRAASQVAYDTERNVAVVFGGDMQGSGLGADDTSIYDSNVNGWCVRDPWPRPFGRYSHGLVYDSAREVCVLFGGSGLPYDRLGDTWLYDANINTWQEESPSTSPSPRSSFGMIYDSLNEVVILFGGSDASGNALGETWIYGNLASTIDIKPETLNLKSKAKFVTCYIELWEGFDVEDIEPGTVAITKMNDVSLESPLYTVGPSIIGDYDGDGIPDLMVKFSGEALISLLKVGNQKLTVAGNLNDGTAFEGSDIIMVIGK